VLVAPILGRVAGGEKGGAARCETGCRIQGNQGLDCKRLSFWQRIEAPTPCGIKACRGFGAVSRIQTVQIVTALELRTCAVNLPALRQDSFKRAAREVDGTAQGALDL